MTKEEKELLLKDLCVRLPYGVKINIRNDYTLTMEDMELNPYHLTTASYDVEYRGLRPYLRSMSSMTKDERKEYDKLIANCLYDAEAYFFENYNRLYDWLNAHHLDFLGLIPMGLALEATEDMYKID